MLSFGWSNDAHNMVVLVAHHGNVIRRTGLRIVLSRSERKRRGFHHAIFALPRMRRVRSVQRITAGNRIWYSLSRRRQHQVGMDGVQWCEEHGYNKTVFCQEMEGVQERIAETSQPIRRCNVVAVHRLRFVEPLLFVPKPVIIVLCHAIPSFFCALLRFSGCGAIEVRQFGWRLSQYESPSSENVTVRATNDAVQHQRVWEAQVRGPGHFVLQRESVREEALLLPLPVVAVVCFHG